MADAAFLRLGSLEIVAALALFTFAATRLRTGAFGAARPRIVELDLRVHEGTAAANGDRHVTIEVEERQTPLIIGRSSQAAVALSDPEVSRRHAQFELNRGIVYLSDLESSNGTFLNGKRLQNGGIEVRTGDEIDVGATRISVGAATPREWT